MPAMARKTGASMPVMAENNRQKRELAKTTMFRFGTCSAMSLTKGYSNFHKDAWGSFKDNNKWLRCQSCHEYALWPYHDAGFAAIDINQRTGRCVSHVPPQYCTIYLWPQQRILLYLKWVHRQFRSLWGCRSSVQSSSSNEPRTGL